MLRPVARVAASLAFAVALTSGLAACGSDDGGSDDGIGGTKIVVTSPAATDEPKKYVPAKQDGSCPKGHPVKVVNVPGEGNRHFTPESDRYDAIRAGFCFEDAASAEAKGFTAG